MPHRVKSVASRQISVFSIQTPDFRVLSADGGVVRRGDPVGVVAKISSNLHQISTTLWYDAFYDNGRTALAHGSMIARSSISKEGGGGSSAWCRLRSHHLFFQARGERAGGARLSLVLRNPLEEGPAAGCRAHRCDLFARWWYNQSGCEIECWGGRTPDGWWMWEEPRESVFWE